MPLLNVSVLVPALFMTREEQQRLRESALEQLVRAAHESLGANTQLNIRGLRPSDLGETNDIWAETTGTTANAYESSQVANQNVPDNTAICMYGVHDMSDVQMVTALRIKGGQAVRAEWDLFPMVTDDKRLDARTGYALSPVIITKTINVEIQYYIRQASPQVAWGVEIQLLGYVAERHGQIIQA